MSTPILALIGQLSRKTTFRLGSCSELGTRRPFLHTACHRGPCRLSWVLSNAERRSGKHVEVERACSLVHVEYPLLAAGRAEAASTGLEEAR